MASKFILTLLFFLPMIFGAVHPIMRGILTFFALVFTGSWVILYSKDRIKDYFPALIPPILLVVHGLVSSFAIPLAWLSILSGKHHEYIMNYLALTEKTNGFFAMSYAPFASRDTAILVLALIFYFICVRHLMQDRKFLKRLLFIITIVAIFEALYGIAQAMLPSLGVLWIPKVFHNSSSGTIIYSNQYAAFLNLCWPMVLALSILEYKSYLRRIPRHGSTKDSQKASRHLHVAMILFFAAIIIALGVIFSNSRAGIIVMFFSLIFSTFSMPLESSKKVGFLTVILGVMFFYSLRIGIGHIINDFFLLPESGFHRYELWKTSLSMLTDHFWTGTGLSSYSSISSVYLKHFPENIFFDRAHNEYLELAIETGVPITSILIIWATSMLIKAARSSWSSHFASLSKVSSDIILKRLAVISLIGFLFHAFFDFVFRLPANLFYAVTLSAILSLKTKRQKR